MGEIDIELDNAIIEVAGGKGGGKFSQAQDLLNSRILNFAQKPAIVYGPNLRTGLVNDLNEAGIRVARNLDELDGMIDKP